MTWMVDEAQKIPNGVTIDRSALKLYPSPDGIQHDECRGWTFRFAKKHSRTIPNDGTLHPFVYERFTLSGVVQYDLAKPYRPENLREHKKLRDYCARLLPVNRRAAATSTSRTTNDNLYRLKQPADRFMAARHILGTRRGWRAREDSNL